MGQFWFIPGTFPVNPSGVGAGWFGGREGATGKRSQTGKLPIGEPKHGPQTALLTAVNRSSVRLFWQEGSALWLRVPLLKLQNNKYKRASNHVHYVIIYIPLPHSLTHHNFSKRQCVRILNFESVPSNNLDLQKILTKFYTFRAIH